MNKVISLIICSRDKVLFDRLVLNITETIGCSHEIIGITGANAINEAYQEGLEKSKGDLCVFLHEDVLFHSNDWGKKLFGYFQKDDNLGLVGVAGSKSKTYIPSAWWDCPEEDKVIRIIQHFSNGEVQEQYQGFTKSKLEQVATIDGVFMALRKSVPVHFDQSLPGFHGYDLDLSLGVKKLGYSLRVSQEILLEHFSIGKLSMSWIKALLHTHRNHHSILPILSSESEANFYQEMRNVFQLFKHYLNLVRKNS